jgi:hypothetical protein
MSSTVHSSPLYGIAGRCVRDQWEGSKVRHKEDPTGPFVVFRSCCQQLKLLVVTVHRLLSAVLLSLVGDSLVLYRLPASVLLLGRHYLSGAEVQVIIVIVIIIIITVKPDPLYTGNLDKRKINFGTELFPM